MRTPPPFPADKLTIVTWKDDLVDSLGHDPRTEYVETFWLGVLGPSATWLLRHIATQLDTHPDGFIMDMAETAQSLGVSGLGKNAPFIRALGRLVHFEMAVPHGVDTLAVRKHLPPLSRRHLMRLPESLRSRHDEWQQQQLTRAS